MKHFGRFYLYFAPLIFLFLTNRVAAQDIESDNEAVGDSVEISLLTCNPGHRIYSLYGHTAIRITDRAHDIDLVASYGIFSFDKPFFVLRFVFGLTDYEIGLTDYPSFEAFYGGHGCGVRQQVLNLTPDECTTVIAAIFRNYEPANRVYRYNYFYDNCTTRARNIIVGNMRHDVSYDDDGERPTYRQMVHAYNADYRWMRFGKDLLLGVMADVPTDKMQQQFLPDNLRKAFDGATVTRDDGTTEPFVKASCRVIPAGESDIKPYSFPLTPIQCAVIFAVLTLIVAATEWRTRRILWLFDVVVTLITGLSGVVLFAMIFSEHPTVSLNFQILLLNPLALVFLYTTVKGLRHHRFGLWLKVWMVLTVLMLVGGLFQHYAEGIRIVALSLLVRYASLYFLCRNGGSESAITKK